MYDYFFNILSKPIHKPNNKYNIKLTDPQFILSQSDIGSKRIKGVAGGGKTLVIAHRAINAYKRTNSAVLILTYNITLGNYIRNIMNSINKEFDWNYFHIIHYHGFITNEANNLEIFKEKSKISYEDENLFDGFEDKLQKYQTILIDEAQDFKEKWIRIIKKYFAVSDDNLEIVAFADEKQNIYGNELDENKLPKIPIRRGRWDESLKTSYRCSTNILILALKFQEYFFANKYNIDVGVGFNNKNYGEMQTGREEQRAFIEYKYFENNNTDNNKIADFIIKSCYEYQLKNGEIAILYCNIEMLRELDYKLRINSEKAKTITMFEIKEIFEESYCMKYGKKNLIKDCDETNCECLEVIRKNYKHHFRDDDNNKIKLSTIYSFKGWECESIFLIIDDDNYTKDNSDELIYTAITRCRNKLFVININNQKYHKFFTSNNVSGLISNINNSTECNSLKNTDTNNNITTTQACEDTKIIDKTPNNKQKNNDNKSNQKQLYKGKIKRKIPLDGVLEINNPDTLVNESHRVIEHFFNEYFPRFKKDSLGSKIWQIKLPNRQIFSEIVKLRNSHIHPEKHEKIDIEQFKAYLVLIKNYDIDCEI